MDKYDFWIRPRYRFVYMLTFLMFSAFDFFLLQMTYENLFIKGGASDFVYFIQGIICIGAFVIGCTYFGVKNFIIFIEKIHVNGNTITVYTLRKRIIQLGDITEATIEYEYNGYRHYECLTPVIDGKKLRLPLEIGEPMHCYDMWVLYIQEAGVRITGKKKYG